MTDHTDDVSDLLVTRGGLLHHGLRRLGLKLPLPAATTLAPLLALLFVRYPMKRMLGDLIRIVL